MYLNLFSHLAHISCFCSAKRFDETIREKIQQANDTGILPNRLNSESKRLHKNRLRKESKMRQAAARHTAITQYDTIRAELEAELANRKQSAEKTKALKDQLATLKASGASYRSQQKGAKRGLQYHPDPEDVYNSAARETGT
jgi:hypothetical protein